MREVVNFLLADPARSDIDPDRE